MARNVRVVTGPRARGEVERAQEFADALMARSLRPRGPEQRGPVQVTMSPWEGVAQLGEAAIGASSQKYARKLAEAEQERVRAANDKLVGQLGGYKEAPRRIEDRAPMTNFGQPTGAPIELPEDMRVPTDKAEKLAAAIAGMDPGTANAALSGVSLQRLLADPESEEAYTLAPGAARYKGNRVIAERPTAEKPPGLPEGMRMNPQTGQPEWIPGYLEAKERLAAAGRSTTSITYDPDGSNRYGAPPAGYYRPDPSQPNVAQMPGGPAALESQQTREKDQARRESQAIKAQGVIGEIDKALGIVSPRTAGLMGAATRNIAPFEGAGTDARTLAATVETIQANLGFDELAKMRQESPTGGALGQVAVQELVALRATIANLDPNLPADVLKKNLEKVKMHYGRWMMTTQGQMPPPLEAAGGQAPGVGQFGLPPADEALIGQFLNQVSNVYTLDQVRQARENAKRAGNMEAYERLSLISYRMAGEQAPVEQNDPTADMGTGQRVLAGIGQGMTNVGRHAANLVGLQSDEQLADAKQLDAPLLATGAGRAGSLIGETAATAPLMMGGAGVVGRVGMGAKVLSNPIARGVVEGAAQGALMADPGEKLAGATMGGAFGGLVPAAGGGLGKVAHGIKRTPEAERLLAQGVDLTPGQMNPGGILNQMEESWQSVPLVGPVIRGARENAQNSFQRAASQTAAAPGARIAQGPADEMLEAAYKSFEPLYDQAKGFPLYPGVMRQAGGDIPLASFGKRPGLLVRAALDRNVRADDATRRSVGRWLDNQITQLPGKGRAQISSDDLLNLRSNIRAEARRAASQGDDAAADLLKNGERALTDTLESQLPPDALQALRTADSRYGIYKTLEDAVARSKDMPGGFTPSKLSEAVAGANRGLGKGSYARGGGGPLRDLSEAGTATMNVRSPATGQRLAAIGLPLAASAAAPGVAVPVGAGLLGMVGTQTGRRAAAGQLPAQKLAQALEEAAKRGVAEPYRNVAAQYLRRASVAGLLGN